MDSTSSPSPATTIAPPASSEKPGFEAPHPGVSAMPRWTTGELPDAPVFTWKNWASMLGPGLLMGGAAIGGGEWLMGPLVTARYGGALLWLATLSILSQVVYNLEISRYTLYSGEPIFTGKFRTPPGPMFWLMIYLILDFGAVFPYLASSAATPVFALMYQRMPDPNSLDVLFSLLGFDITDKSLLTGIGAAIYVLAMVPLIFGGKVYNSLKVVMSFKIVTVFGFLMVVAFLYSQPSTWREIASGFVKFGNVPVTRGEDLNGNGKLDPGEDWDGDGRLDVVEEEIEDKPGEFNDVDQDGIRDGDNVDNIFLSLAEGRGFPDINFNMIAILCAMVAISGQGGLSNTPLSNYTRDQGWGMGSHVGAIPSVVGGHHLQLSHVGCVFEVTEESLPRWRRWYRHVMRDQLVVWMPACFIGLGLPSILSVQFLRRGTQADNWTAAGMTATNIGEYVNGIHGAMWGNFFWFMTLFCGLLVLAPTACSTADGAIRRWLDVFWTASPRLRRVDPRAIGKLYFGVLCAYVGLGLLMLFLVEGKLLLVIAGNFFNYALGFSCWHALAVNVILLPRELRPNWFIRIALFLAGLFFIFVAGLTSYTQLVKAGYLG
ncbi:MAG TPA: Nramp family divalent metal transporter [Pirellulales bacterium]|nr:Nramp family divalent metal transporter [Pirellulales bacterium]